MINKKILLYLYRNLKYYYIKLKYNLIKNLKKNEY